MDSIVGVDIGGTNTRIGLMRGDKLERADLFPSRDVFGEGDEIEALGNLIASFRGSEKAAAVSIGFPSANMVIMIHGGV